MMPSRCYPLLAATILLMAAGHAAQAAGPAMIATNLPGIFSVAGPPDGFDAVKASDAELIRYGFPPRPARSDHRATASWEAAMHAARHRLLPMLQQTSLAAGPVRRGTIRPLAGDYASMNWSAVGIVNQATSFGATSYTFVGGRFNVPTARQAFGACTGAWDHLFTWVGLDGWLNNEVFQAGTESDAYCDGNGPATYYSAWFEWFPSLSVRVTNLGVTPGDIMLVWMIPASSTTGSAVIINQTTGNYVVIGFSAPAGTYLVGNSAEWVQERPYWNNVLSTLTNYVAAYMSNMGAWQKNLGNALLTPGSPGPGYGISVTMLDDAGQPISSPQPLGGNAAMFQDEGSAN